MIHETLQKLYKEFSKIRLLAWYFFLIALFCLYRGETMYQRYLYSQWKAIFFTPGMKQLKCLMVYLY